MASSAPNARVPNFYFDLMERQRFQETMPYELYEDAIKCYWASRKSKPMWVPTKSGKGLGKIMDANNGSMTSEEHYRSQHRPIDISRIQSRARNFDPAGLQDRKEKRAFNAALIKEEKERAAIMHAEKYGPPPRKVARVTKKQPLSAAQKALRNSRARK